MLEGASCVPESKSPYRHHICCHLDILAFGGVRNKASCGWYFCIATLRDWQYLAGKMKGTFPQSLELLGDRKKGASWYGVGF